MKLVSVCLAAALLGLVGCAGTEQLSAKLRAMKGKSQSDVLACLGPPEKSANLEGLSFWSYRFETIDRNGVWNCQLRINLKDGRVIRTEALTTKENAFGTSLDLCLSAIEGC